ncbi:MAG: L-lactate dehydrogenase [Erysipelotrichaceae bacterium]|nr:L-lactate dehydrogenase [Erysipelotrichaceae bacterium]
MNTKRKVVLVGTGFVGMSFAYMLTEQKGIDELVLIDVLMDKAEGEAMDLIQGSPFSGNPNMDIHAGTYAECGDASVIVITAGAAQKPGQTRLELVDINTKIMKSIGEQIKASGFNGVIIVASNPCDLMTYVAMKSTGLPASQVLGSGTMLDTSRLRQLVGKLLVVNPSNVHAYIMGEHGDNSFVPWTNANIGCKPLLEELEEQGIPFDQILNVCWEEVRDSAYRIIEKKKATYYAIGKVLARLVATVVNDENAVLTVSAWQNGEYGQEGLYVGVPAVVNRNGVREVIKLQLTEPDQAKFDRTCGILKDIINNNCDPILNGTK